MTLDQIREELAGASKTQARMRRKLEDSYAEILRDPKSDAAAGLKAAIAGLRTEAAQLRERATGGVARELDPRQFAGQLDGEIPLLLLPLRVQTRFQNTANGRTLLIRVYPDDISVERHEPRLSDAERQAGQAFWGAADADRQGMWRGMVARFNLRRAAWILKATGPGQAPPADLLEAPLLVPAAWTLPERLIFRLYGPSDHLLAELPGAPIPDGLEMGLDPTREDLGFNRDNGGLNFPPELKWQTDFGAAVAVGMGLAVSLVQLGNPSQIARIVVAGVKLGADEKRSAALLERLIEGHRYTEGFSLLPQGTPTNVTGDAGVPVGPDVDETLARLLGTGAYPGDGRDVLYEDECDGLRLAHALGISPDTLRHVEHAGQEDGREAIAMKRALWAGTLGYYAQHMLAPLLDGPGQQLEETVLAARFFFTNFVFGRGPLPAIRVGDQPYGVLPVSVDQLQPAPNSFELWGRGGIDSFVTQLHEKLVKLAPTWIQLTGKVARAGAGANANARLIDVLSQQASSVEWRSERMVGPDYLKFSTDFKKQGLGLDTPFNSYLAQLTERFTRANAELPGLFPLPPRIFQLSFLGSYWRNITDELGNQVKGLDRGLVPPFTGDVVDHQPYSESRGIAPAYPNYIDWLAKAGFADVRRGLTRTNAKGEPEPVTALLYMALRHSLLYEQAFLAMRLYKHFQAVPPTGRAYAWSDFAEKEVYNIGYAFDTTSWDYLQMAPLVPWPLGARQPLRGSVLELIQRREALRAEVPNWKTHFGDLDETSRALALFAAPDFPTARLERLFAEHMDLASYRLDAWATGCVYQRLLAYRTWGVRSREGRKHPVVPEQADPHLATRFDLNQRPLGPYTNGIYLGAYGWVENVMAGPAPAAAGGLPAELEPQNGGAVTRDPDNFGFIHAPSLNQAVTAAVLRSASVTQPDTSAYNIDLSSARTRDALWMMEGVRNGQSPAALLGYRFERGLRERNPALQQWLPQLRAAFPMPRQTGTDPGAKEAIPAHDVVNGLLIVQARRDGTLGSKTTFALGDAAAFGPLADGLLDLFDACSDLMLAESVHQAVQGNYDRAGGVVTAAGEFTHVPAEFQVVQTPRSGTALSHRVLLALADPAAAAAGVGSPRARLEPGLNQWLASLIGPLAGISAQLTYRFAGGSTAFTVPFDQLGLEPIDLLFITDSRVESDLNGRLELIARPQFDAAHPTTAITEILIDTARASAALALLDAARSLLTSARPATLRDFVAPSTLHGLTAGAMDGIDEDELIRRVLGVTRLDPGQRIAGSLWASFEDTRARVTAAVGDPIALLLEAAAFGIPEAVPAALPPAEQLKSVRGILDARHEAALAKWTPFNPPAEDVLRVCREVTEALLGGAFPLMPHVTLVTPLPVLARDNPSEEQIDDWLFQMSTVRESARRLQDTRVLAAELAAAPLPAIQVIQWPATNPDWIALPTPPGTQLAGDAVALALQPLGPFDAVPAVAPFVVAALLVDEWSETIPAAEETTGIAFHYDAPNAEPPQTVLLAVSQRVGLRWTWNEVMGSIDQALLLAKVRCIGPDELRTSRLDPVLPATLAAESVYPATISTSWIGNMVSEVAHLNSDILKRT